MAMGTKRNTARNRTGSAVIETLEARQLMSAWYVSNAGSDNNSGSVNSPWASLQHAVDSARTGDTIIMRGGSYNGGIRIDKAGLTIRSAVGETARIASPINDAGAEVTIRIGEDAHNTRLENLDISGGYYYTLKTESTWDTGASDPHGPRNLQIVGNKIHDSGRDVIKLTPATDYAQIVRNEIYNSGRRDGSNAEGIDAVQANYASFRKNFVHDTTTNGIYFKGGSVRTVIAKNIVTRTGHSGILLGQASDENWFNTDVNPYYYESIDGVVKDNIVTDTEGAGIGAWAALRPRIFNNTLVNVAKSMFAGLLVQGQEHWPYEGPLAGQYVVVPSTDVTLANNIVQVSGARPALEVREAGLTGWLKSDNNLFYQPGGQARFSDVTRGFSGSLAQWKALGYDTHSREGNPSFSSTGTYQLAANSPAINAGQTMPAYRDFDGTARPAGSLMDIGAQEFLG